MSQMYEVKDCPFCGVKATIEGSANGDGRMIYEPYILIGCPSCLLKFRAPTFAEALSKWNMRQDKKALSPVPPPKAVKPLHPSLPGISLIPKKPCPSPWPVPTGIPSWPYDIICTLDGDRK